MAVCDESGCECGYKSEFFFRTILRTIIEFLKTVIEETVQIKSRGEKVNEKDNNSVINFPTSTLVANKSESANSCWTFLNTDVVVATITGETNKTEESAKTRQEPCRRFHVDQNLLHVPLL